MSKIKLAVQDITPRADGNTEELRAVRINIIDEESTAAEEVNVYTNPESILMKPGSDENILDHIDDRTIYTNNTPIPTDIGGPRLLTGRMPTHEGEPCPHPHEHSPPAQGAQEEDQEDHTAADVDLRIL